jgi:hypothetical protein
VPITWNEATQTWDEIQGTWDQPSGPPTGLGPPDLPGEMGGGSSGWTPAGARIFHVYFDVAMSPMVASTGTIGGSEPPILPFVDPEMGDDPAGARYFHSPFSASLQSLTGTLQTLFVPLNVGPSTYQVMVEAAMGQFSGTLAARKNSSVAVFPAVLNGSMDVFSGKLDFAKRVAKPIIGRTFKVRSENRTFVVMPDRETADKE